jgi:hypothetical protein
MVPVRRRLDAFFGHPRAAEFATTLRPPLPRPPTTAAAALRSRLDEVLTRLGVVPAGDVLRLRKSLTLHDGQVVAMTGDSVPIGPDEDVRVITTTTTVLDGDRMRSETTVLVFEGRSRM